MPVDELNYRKKQLVQELNGFIGLKKAYAAQAQQRSELIGQSTPSGLTQEEMNSERPSPSLEAYNDCGELLCNLITLPPSLFSSNPAPQICKTKILWNLVANR